MIDLLSLSRAARLAGVSRAALQARIRRGEITTFEGQVRAQDLLRIYPSVSLEHTGLLDQVERIKANAMPRDPERDHPLPSPAVLLSRLRALSDALAAQVSRADGLHALIAKLREQLTHAIPERDRRERLLGWLDAECAALAEQPESEARRRLFAKDNVLRLLAASVKLIPSGHEFFVEGSESILDAAVRAGLRVNYGCANGNCGSCKARLIGGEAWKLREHDYVLSARERQMGYLLSCCHTAVTDLVLEAAEAQSAADLPQQEIPAQIRKIERQNADLLLLRVQTPRTQRLRFMAGQSARLRLANGVTTELPIASCPCDGRNLHFYVRRGRDAFADALFGQTAGRTPVLLSGPHGEFMLRETDPAAAVFIAFTDGIAPIKSLIEHAVSIDLAASLHLYWSTPGTDGFYLEGWCRALRDALDAFAYTPLLEVKTEDLLALIRADLPAPATAAYYLAGPPATLAPLCDRLGALGVAKDRIATFTH